jgi:hypothetical protein
VDLKRYNDARIWFLFLGLVYLAQSLFFSNSKVTLAKYHVSEAELKALMLTIVIPYLVIWGIALAGYLRLSAYASKIRNSRDGDAFQTIATGVLWLALWLPVSAVLSSLTTQIYQEHGSMTAGLVIFSNYVNLAILFPAFYIVHRGSQKLLGVIKLREHISIRSVVLIVAFSALYTMLVLQDPARRVPSGAATTAAYYQPDWLIVVTIVIPRLIMWFFGIQAVYNIYRYMNNVKGSIYKDALRVFANGIAGVLVVSIVLRCMQSLSSQMGALSLVLVLVIVYALLLAISVGYIFMAMGAKRLSQIEDL